MEINHLKVIQLLVADPNLSRTAERLHLTQSALSKRVQQIEAELGTTLFERRGPLGLRPLPHALELAKLADRVLTAWDTGIKRIQRSADEPEHFVLVGPQIFLREMVLPWWHRVADQFPDIRLEVQVSALARVSLETIQLGADAGILEHKEELGDFVCKPIYKEQWGIVRHPRKKHDDLRKYTWATVSPQDSPVDNWLVRTQKMPPPTYRLYWQDMPALADWVAENPGAATVVPWHSVATRVQDGRLAFESLGNDATTLLYLAYQKGNRNARLLQALSKISSDTERSP